MKESSTPKLQAPYMSFGIFKSTIEMLAETVVPTGALDRRVLHGLSGGDYGSLISGLRFLGLVDEGKKPTQKYRELVQASKDAPKFKGLLLQIITQEYKAIVGKVDLQHGTIAELEKAFKDYGVPQGQMLDKSIRFFIKSLSECGFALSPHITKPKPRAPRSPNVTAKNVTAKKNGDKGRGKPADIEQETPQGYERLPLPGVPNSFIQYPANLTEAHCQILEAMVGVLKTSVKARTGAKGATA
jgi:hypothetical protein